MSTEKDAAVEIASSGVLPSLAQVLRSRSPLSCQVALLVAEMAREGSILLQVLAPLFGLDYIKENNIKDFSAATQRQQESHPLNTSRHFRH